MTSSSVQKALKKQIEAAELKSDQAFAQTLETAPLRVTADPRTMSFEQIRDQYAPLLSRECASAGGSGVDWAEKIQVAMLALWEAHKHWRPDGGASFQTYATHAIRNALRKRIREEKGLGIADLPAHRPMSRQVPQWEAALGRSLDPEEIDVLEEKGDPRRHRLLTQGWPGTGRRGDEHLPGPHEQTHLAALVSRTEQAQLDRAAETVLSERDRAIVLAWMAGTSQREIGQAVGLSQSRICQLLPDLVATVMKAAPRMSVDVPDALTLVEPPVNNPSWLPSTRPPEPPRTMRELGDLFAHVIGCTRPAEAIVVTTNRRGATLPYNVTCSVPLGGCGAGVDTAEIPSEVSRIQGPLRKRRISRKAVRPLHGFVDGISAKHDGAVSPVARRVPSLMDDIWRET